LRLANGYGAIAYFGERRRDGIRQQAISQAIATDECLWAERGCGNNDSAAAFGIADQYPGEDLGDHFVLAGLAAKRNGELLSATCHEVMGQRARRLQLVATHCMRRHGELAEGGNVAQRGVELGYPSHRRRTSMSTLPIAR